LKPVLTVPFGLGPPADMKSFRCASTVFLELAAPRDDARLSLNRLETTGFLCLTDTGGGTIVWNES
jgi:hypothetical protein